MIVFSIFALVALCALAIFAFIIVALIRAIARGSGSGGSVVAPVSGGIANQMGADGFWIFSCPHDPGSILHYHYWCNGLRRGGKVPYQPGADGRQFIYTGERPERAVIVQVDEVDDSGIVLMPPPIIAASTTIWDSSSGPMDNPPAPPAPSGFPSAY